MRRELPYRWSDFTTFPRTGAYASSNAIIRRATE
jgi:hypothetical protein